jgi:predicted dehydrogenase
VFGRPDGSPPGSLTMTRRGVEVRHGPKDTRALDIEPLPAEEAEPVAYMVSRIKADKSIEGLTAIDINVKVIHIIDLAKESVKTGRAVKVAQ